METPCGASRFARPDTSDKESPRLWVKKDAPYRNTKRRYENKCISLLGNCCNNLINSNRETFGIFTSGLGKMRLTTATTLNVLGSIAHQS